MLHILECMSTVTHEHDSGFRPRSIWNPILGLVSADGGSLSSAGNSNFDNSTFIAFITFAK